MQGSKVIVKVSNRQMKIAKISFIRLGLHRLYASPTVDHSLFWHPLSYMALCIRGVSVTSGCLAEAQLFKPEMTNAVTQLSSLRFTKVIDCFETTRFHRRFRSSYGMNDRRKRIKTYAFFKPETLYCGPDIL